MLVILWYLIFVFVAMPLDTIISRKGLKGLPPIITFIWIFAPAAFIFAHPGGIDWDAQRQMIEHLFRLIPDDHWRFGLAIVLATPILLQCFQAINDCTDLRLK